jgi:hypothetical protein
VDRVGDAVDGVLALLVARLAPALVGLAGRGDGAVEVLLGRNRTFADNLSGAGIADLQLFGCRDLLARNDETIALHHVLHVGDPL